MNARKTATRAFATGLIGILSTIGPGCNTLSKVNPTNLLHKTATVINNSPLVHEVFRTNESKNEEPVSDIIKIDYSEYDKEHNYKIINSRGYLRDDENTPPKTLETLVDVPQSQRFKIPSLNATYIKDNSGRVIMQYHSRLAAPDLKKIVEEYIPNIKITEFPNQNILIFNGPETEFGDFSYLSTLLNEFDLPALQVRLRMKIVEYFADNTYDRELAIKVLRNGANTFSLNLPSNADETKPLTTGIDINPFFNANDPNVIRTYEYIPNPAGGVGNIIRHVTEVANKFNLSGAIKFLDSHGKVNIVSDVDVLVSNGTSVFMRNINSVPYPEFVVLPTSTYETLKYRDIGTEIKMTPYANEEGLITVKVEQGKSGEQAGYVGTVQRIVFRESDINTDVTIRNGETYFLGATLFTRYKSVDRGIPGLNKIPFINGVITSRSIENNQSQLFYFLEARVIERDSLVGTQQH